MNEIIECVPNFSEGRDLSIVRRIAASIEQVASARVLDTHTDEDHNRSVITYIVAPERAVEAALMAGRAARDLIDLRRHTGAHPRLGAMDVLPFVPVRGVTIATCARLAHAAGARIADELSVPVYFYGEAALHIERARLEVVRGGGFERRRTNVLNDESLAPDVAVGNQPGLHETAGAFILGARKFLIAFNINLTTNDVRFARHIARKVRASGGGLAAVKALGIYLNKRDCAQVSMNLVDYEQTSIAQAFAAVRREAENLNIGIKESELVGLVPRAAFDEQAAYAKTIRGLSPMMILENHL